MEEGQETEKKSLKILTDKNPDWDTIVKECVAFANANGGFLLIGIEDNADEPPVQQKIDRSKFEQLQDKVNSRTYNVAIYSEIKLDINGGEYISIKVQRNTNSIASTSDGRYFIRVSDKCKPLLSDDLNRLFSEKNAYVWETRTSRKINYRDCDKKKLEKFLISIAKSNRVSKFVKEKSQKEILEYYNFVREGFLTNLGVLWIGKRENRTDLLYSPVIQFIKYDEFENKTNKIVWDEFSLNPYELIQQVINEIPDWQEGIEIEDGMFRKEIYDYDISVIRELISNALVHKPYTIRGDIFINLYSDRLEVHNPGLLPLGVTPQNILHKSEKRNEHLAKVFYDLNLMEREGSGYDMIYKLMLQNGKKLPEVSEGNDRVKVTLYKRIINNEIIKLTEKINKEFQLTQKEQIILGIIAQRNTLSAIEISRILGLPDNLSVSNWIGKLIKYNIVKSKGKTKGKEYFINPEILKKAKFKGKTNLKKVENYRIKELIIEDLKIYKECSISDLHERIGNEISRRKILRELLKLKEQKIIDFKGGKKWRRYFLLDKKV
jgi:ATP-dependent DNA helicase RecG